MEEEGGEAKMSMRRRCQREVMRFLTESVKGVAEVSKSAVRGWHLIRRKFMEEESNMALRFLINITGR